MKDIQSYVIGFLTCACLFLIMGQADGEKSKHYDTYLEVEKGNVTIEASEHGRYQAISGEKYEYIYLLDTGTGEVYNHIENPDNTYKKRLADIWSDSPYVHALSK